MEHGQLILERRQQYTSQARLMRPLNFLHSSIHVGEVDTRHCDEAIGSHRDEIRKPPVVGTVALDQLLLCTRVTEHRLTDDGPKLERETEVREEHICSASVEIHLPQSNVGIGGASNAARVEHLLRPLINRLGVGTLE